MSRKKSSLPWIAALLLNACNAPLPTPPPLPDAASPVAQLMSDRCGRCHGAPHPALHSANEWPNVVFRMQKHMAQKGQQALTPAEYSTVLEYLQKHAQP